MERVDGVNVFYESEDYTQKFWNVFTRHRFTAHCQLRPEFGNCGRIQLWMLGGALTSLRITRLAQPGAHTQKLVEAS